MLKELFDKLARRNEVYVGVITGELHDEWLRKNTETTLLRLEAEIAQDEFNLEFFKRHIVDGKLTVDPKQLPEMAESAYFTEQADAVNERMKRSVELEIKELELWGRTYEALGISPDENYRLNSWTGEVFMVIDNNDGGEGNARPLH